MSITRSNSSSILAWGRIGECSNLALLLTIYTSTRAILMKVDGAHKRAADHAGTNDKRGWMVS